MMTQYHLLRNSRKANSKTSIFSKENKASKIIRYSPGARGQFWTNWGANSNLPRVVGICLKFQKKYVSKAEFSCKCVFCRPE